MIKTMKKVLAIILAIVLIGSVAACVRTAKHKNAETNTTLSDTVYGRWVADHVKSGDSTFSLKEWKNMEDIDLSDVYIIIKEGDKAYMFSDGSGYITDWKLSDEKITIDGETGEYKNGEISFKNYGDIYVYFKKTSDSQVIPDTTEETTESPTTTEKPTTEKATEKKETTEKTTKKKKENAEWKEFLESYEKWVDKYIEILKKYKENPYDVTILGEYSELLSELDKWTEKEEAMEKALEDDPEAYAEYIATLARINKKITEIQ